MYQRSGGEIALGQATCHFSIVPRLQTEGFVVAISQLSILNISFLKINIFGLDFDPTQNKLLGSDIEPLQSQGAWV